MGVYDAQPIVIYVYARVRELERDEVDGEKKTERSREPDRLLSMALSPTIGDPDVVSPIWRPLSTSPKRL